MALSQRHWPRHCERRPRKGHQRRQHHVLDHAARPSPGRASDRCALRKSADAKRVGALPQWRHARLSDRHLVTVKDHRQGPEDIDAMATESELRHDAGLLRLSAHGSARTRSDLRYTLRHFPDKMTIRTVAQMPTLHKWLQRPEKNSSRSRASHCSAAYIEMPRGHSFLDNVDEPMPCRSLSLDGQPQPPCFVTMHMGRPICSSPHASTWEHSLTAAVAPAVSTYAYSTYMPPTKAARTDTAMTI